MPDTDDRGLGIFRDEGLLDQAQVSIASASAIPHVWLEFPATWLEDFTEFINSALWHAIEDNLPEDKAGPYFETLKQAYAIYARLIDLV